MGCGESKNAVATANTISHRKKSNAKDTIINEEGDKENHNGQDLVAEKSENSKPRDEGGHEDEEKAAKKDGDDEIGGDVEERKDSQGSPDQSLSPTDGIDRAVSDGLSGKSEDVSGSKISKVEVKSAEKKHVLEEAETKNQNGSESENNKEEGTSSDIQPIASSPEDEQKEKA